MIESKVGEFQRTHNVSVTAAHHIKVSDVIQFANALRERGIPDDVQVGQHNDYNTGHFISMSVSYTETLES